MKISRDLADVTLAELQQQTIESLKARLDAAGL